MSNNVFCSLDESSRNKLKNDLHDFYIPYRKTLNLPSIVTFGTEIEFKHPKYNDNYISGFMDFDNAARILLEDMNFDFNDWKIENEINNHIEVISPVLTDGKTTWQELDNVLTFLKNNGCYYSKECGAHIHIGKAIFNKNPLGWINFFKMWYVFEDFIFLFSNGEEYNTRQNANSKAKKISQICKNIINDYNSFSIIDSSYLSDVKIYCIRFTSGFNGVKYQTDLNTTVTNYTDNDKEKTIEFRNPNGTLNKVIWQNNVNFFAKLLLSCANENFDNEKLDYLYVNKSLASEFDLCDFVFDNDFDKLCFLRQYYKDFEENGMGYSKKFWK